MRFTADRKKLLGPLQLAIAAAGKPPLSSVYCSADADELTLTGTDNELAVTVRVPATVESCGVCLLPQKLEAILKESPGEDVSVTVGKTLIVGTGGDVYDLPVEDAGGFPVPPDPPAPVLTLPGDVLRSAIDRTAFAASKDEHRYALRAVAWDGDKLVATDGKRLAVAEVPKISGGPYLLPPKAVVLVREIADREVGVVLRKNDAFFTSEAGTVWTRLVEGRLPPWRDVIPPSGPTLVVLDTGEFVRAVKRAALCADSEAKRVTVRFAEDAVTLCAEGQPGRSAVRHAAKSHAGPAVAVDFDPQYLTDLIRFGDEAELSILSPEKAVVFRAGDGLLLVIPLC